MKILFIFGTRPEAIKMVPIIVNAVCQTEIDRSNVKRVFSHSSLATKELRRNTYGQNLSVLRPFSI